MIAVQIGSNRGFDDFTDLIQNENINKLILVEPFIEHNESLLKCYSHVGNINLENIIITDDENLTKEKIYFHEEDTNHINKFELASLNKTHSIKVRNHYTENGVCYRELDCLCINRLLEKYNLTKIDILYIDTEGFDDKIIKSINFNKFIIDKIYYENLHINGMELNNFLINKNYVITHNVGYGGWSDYAELKK